MTGRRSEPSPISIRRSARVSDTSLALPRSPAKPDPAWWGNRPAPGERRRARSSQLEEKLVNEFLYAARGDGNGCGDVAAQTFLELFARLGLTPDDQDVLG